MTIFLILLQIENNGDQKVSYTWPSIVIVKSILVWRRGFLPKLNSYKIKTSEKESMIMGESIFLFQFYISSIHCCKGPLIITEDWWHFSLVSVADIILHSQEIYGKKLPSFWKSLEDIGPQCYKKELIWLTVNCNSSIINQNK